MATKTIEIPGSQQELVILTLQGTSPVMTNRMSEDAEQAIITLQSGEPKARTKAPRDPEKEYQAAIHKTSDGKNGIGAWQFKKALAEGGYRIFGEKMTFIEAAITIRASDPTGVIPLDAPPPEMDKRWGRLQGKATTMLYRPRYMPWKLDLPVAFESDIIRIVDLVNLVTRTGFSVGVGAGRRIEMGRFEVVAIDGQPVEKRVKNGR